MIETNPATGFYMQKYFFKDEIFQCEGCVPAAIGNYLLVKGFSQEIAQNVVDCIEMDHRAGVGIHKITTFVNGALYQQFGRFFNPELYYRFRQDLPTGCGESINDLDIGKIDVPAVVLTKLDKDLSHMWVMIKKDSVVEGIDLHGVIDKIDYPIDGYLEIKGLEYVTK